MKKLLVIALVALIGACSANNESIVSEKETYPYGMTEKEWNELSIQDKTKLRRDFYFYEKGNTKFVKPDLEVKGDN